MLGIDIATITSGLGIAGYAISGVASSLFHKLTKQHSFIVSVSSTQIIIRNNPVTRWFTTISYFSILSVSTFMIAGNRSGNYIYLQLCFIYLVCFVLAAVGFYKKKKHIVVIDKKLKMLTVNTISYPFNDLSTLEISDRSSWLTDDFDSYGLCLKTQGGKRILVYGYSVFKDIEKLRQEIEIWFATFS